MSTKITFTLPAEVVANASSGLLLGDFNNWDDNKAPQLKKAKRWLHESHIGFRRRQNLSIPVFIR